MVFDMRAKARTEIKFMGANRMKKWFALLFLAVCLLLSSCANFNQEKKPVLNPAPLKSVAPHVADTPAPTALPSGAIEQPKPSAEKGAGYYSSKQYGFSISYPKEWGPYAKSPSLNGAILYEKDGSIVQVQGGRIDRKRIKKEIQQAEEAGFEVYHVITARGERGTWMEGSKEVLRFVIAGKEKYFEFIAVTKQAFYNENQAVLYDTAKRLFLKEEPDRSAFLEGDPLEAYKKYLAELPTEHVRNVTLAEKMFLMLVGEDKSVNDKLQQLFEEFYDDVIFDADYPVIENGHKINEQALQENGLRINFSESGEYFAAMPGYLYDHFARYLTDASQEYLLNLKTEAEGAPNTYLIEDAMLSISYNELSDRITLWEDFAKKYPKDNRAHSAEENAKFYLQVYLDPFNSSLPDSEGALEQEVRESYVRFIENYPNSKYHKAVKGFYKVLAENDFMQTEEVEKYLADRGFEG